MQQNKYLAYFIFTFLSIACTKTLKAQDEITASRARTLLKVTENYYNQEDYFYKSDMRSYTDDSSPYVDRNLGYIHKKGKILETYQLGLYSIQNEEIKITIDSNNKEIILLEPDGIYKKQSFTELDSLTLEKQIKHLLYEENANGFKIDFIYDRNYQFKSVTAFILKTGFLKELNIIYRSENASTVKENEELISTTLSIVYEIEDTERDLIFNVSDVISYNDDIISLTPKFYQYELIDFRYHYEE